ncbi:hypothetical protein GOM49_06450 [Clostridium bovifaecis]|uniref:Uncharacterized protein n=1 Tax=Clostridium bovifaecis TaxID=2184719 RepID=A0A6I6F0I6_9CLOT|nr:hypothetical protein GOM49_06450 [Clostridium bovifaecis]
MSLESIIEDSFEKALAKGGKKALVKGVEELIDDGVVEEVTKRVINVAVVEIVKVIQVGVALAIGKAIIGSSIVKSEEQLEQLKKGIISSIATQYDDGKVSELIKEIFQSDDKNDNNIKQL